MLSFGCTLLFHLAMRPFGGFIVIGMGVTATVAQTIVKAYWEDSNIRCNTYWVMSTLAVSIPSCFFFVGPVASPRDLDTYERINFAKTKRFAYRKVSFIIR